MYTALEDWLSYAAARGETAPAAATAQDQAAALQRGDDHVRRTYVSRFPSSIDLGATDVAAALAEAVHIAAGLELETPGVFATLYSGKDLKTLTKVGDLEWSLLGSTSQAGGAKAQTRATAIEALLAPYVGDTTRTNGQPNIGAYLV